MPGMQPPLRPIRPAPSGALWALLLMLLPLLLRWRVLLWLPAGIARVEVEHGERLAALLEQFRLGRCRLLLAFRHSDVDDPLCGLWLLSRGLPRTLRPQPVQFLYDRGMPLWGGRPLGWVLSRLGGISLRRGRHPDWSALRQARQLLRDGPFPLALAPEGATNGHGERLGPLEPGAARLALWCRDDLRRAGREEAVWIVPIGLRYRYRRPCWARLDRLLARLERQAGLAPPPPSAAADPDTFRYRRLLRLGEELLTQLERFYARFGEESGSAAPAPEAQLPLAERITRLRARVLELAEARLGLRGAGTAEDRCRRIEEMGWQWIHREDLPPRRTLPPLQRGLADWTASEAALALRHMRLVETFVAVSGGYVAESPSFERFAETALLLHDGLERLRGASLPSRPSLGWRRARLWVAEPISVGAADPVCADLSPRGSARGEVLALMDLLRRRLLQAMQEREEPPAAAGSGPAPQV
ncbi:MAG: hypothetical protein ER33_00630 [Cyanobium sp. CACIAM 14]|nr:MAG: hypothetical protein ER33_00630 [Cyanobium sp. CACIAM 14]